MTIYSDKPWLKHYDPHVPPTLEPYPQIPIFEILQHTAQESPENIALTTTVRLPLFGRMDSHMTYAQLDKQSNTLAAGLKDKGLQKGEKVAIMMPNCTAFAVSYYGVLKAGGVVVATNPTYPPNKLEHQLNDSDAAFVICLSMFYQAVKDIQSNTRVRHVIVSNIKEYFPMIGRILFTLAKEKKDGHRLETLEKDDFWFQEIIQQYANQRPDVTVTDEDLAIFQYTGGTTGISKGAMATHRALVANVLMLQRWSGISSPEVTAMNGSELVYLGAIPLFHSFGLVALLTQATASGSTIVLVPNARDIDDVVDVIDYYRPNVFLGVPALFNAVNNHPRVQSGEVSLECFTLNASGSAPLPAITKSEFEALSHSVITEAFGMSETPVATHSNPLFGQHKIGSIGLPFPDIDCRIVSLADGETDVPVGEEGELLIAGPNVMTGYFNMPTETANTLREKDGKTWLYTGDIARMDEEGYFYIVDRKKDMALIGGFNVYPASIEKVLKEHPAIYEVGVASIPHPEKPGQETLKAWIVLQPQASVTGDELIHHCEQYLVAYEIPRRYEFITELPKSIVGKTLRRELVKMEHDKSVLDGQPA